jgi:hypothetical protein
MKILYEGLYAKVGIKDIFKPRLLLMGKNTVRLIAS